MKFSSIAVFCGSQMGTKPVYAKHAAAIGAYLGQQKIRLIYGGGKKGLMGAVADAVMKEGGSVTGIIPELLVGWEHQHDSISDLQIVADMHSRKKIMYDLCDCALILPGGNGTLDEMFEMLTWNTLKIHSKTIVLLNIDGFYNHLIAHMDTMAAEGFLYEDWKTRLEVCTSAGDLITFLDAGKY